MLSLPDDFLLFLVLMIFCTSAVLTNRSLWAICWFGGWLSLKFAGSIDEKCNIGVGSLQVPNALPLTLCYALKPTSTPATSLSKTVVLPEFNKNVILVENCYQIWTLIWTFSDTFVNDSFGMLLFFFCYCLSFNKLRRNIYVNKKKRKKKTHTSAQYSYLLYLFQHDSVRMRVSARFLFIIIAVVRANLWTVKSVSAVNVFAPK